MDKKQIALEYLNQNKLLNADMIDSINHNEADILYAQEKGVMVYNISSGAYVISADEGADIDSMLSLCKKETDCFMIHQDFYYPLIKDKFGLEKKMECYQAVYTRPLPPNNPYDFEIKALTLDYVNFVVRSYTHPANVDYITDRIMNNFMYGAFLGDEVMGFIGVHDEGAMGMLEVMSNHRKKGIGYALEAFLIKEKLNKGRIPYAHIVTSNTASYNLQKKLGLQFADSIISWIF